MKRILFWALLSFGISTIASAQVFSSDEKNKISEAKKQMDQNELSQMTEAETNFEEAQFALESISSEEYKVDQMFSKGTSSKNEKKAVNVKRTKVDASKKNEKGFTGMYDAMEVRLGKLPLNKDNKVKTRELRAQAAEKMTAGTAAIEDYKFRDDSDLETYPYATLKDKIAQANTAYKEAILLELQCFAVFNEQTLSAINPEATAPTSNEGAAVSVSSEPASQPTTPTNDASTSSSSGVTVETSAPSGSSSSSAAVTVEQSPAPVAVIETPAPAPVAETPAPVAVVEAPVPSSVTVETHSTPVASQPVIEAVKPSPVPTAVTVSTPQAKATIAAKPSKKVASTKTPQTAAPVAASVAKAPETQGTIYRVQIIAVSKGALSEAATKKIYSGSEKIYEEQDNGYYKYCVGDFTSLSQAKQLKETLSGDCFVVLFRNGKRVQ